MPRAGNGFDLRVGTAQAKASGAPEHRAATSCLGDEPLRQDQAHLYDATADVGASPGTNRQERPARVPGAGDDARETVGVDRPEATSTVRPETLRRKVQSDDDRI